MGYNFRQSYTAISDIMDFMFIGGNKGHLRISCCNTVKNREKLIHEVKLVWSSWCKIQIQAKIKIGRETISHGKNVQDNALTKLILVYLGRTAPLAPV